MAVIAIDRHNKNKTTHTLKIVKDVENQENQYKHISFFETIKYFYFNKEEPIVTPRYHNNLKLNRANLLISNDSEMCKLESFTLNDYMKTTNETLIRLVGSVLVRNASYEKKVTIRYSLTEWKTFSDLDAFFIESVNDEIDRFAFVIKIDPILFLKTTSVNISLAIKYEWLDCEFWDNNRGFNYKFSLSFLK